MNIVTHWRIMRMCVLAGTRIPFTFGDLALDEAFTDRIEELEELETDMLNGLNVALIAPRRYGKTSLVRRAAQELHSDGVLVAEVDLMKTPTKERFASHLARAIHDDLASVLMKAKDALDLITERPHLADGDGESRRRLVQLQLRRLGRPTARGHRRDDRVAARAPGARSPQIARSASHCRSTSSRRSRASIPSCPG